MSPVSAVGPFLSRARSAARAILGCDHLAADALQETLLAYWMQGEPPPEPGAWLMRAVTLRALQLKRGLQRRRNHEQVAAVCREHPDCDNPLHHACAHELAERLHVALERLPADQRRVFDVVRGGSDYATTAGQLEVPVGTVRSRLARARAALHLAIG